MSHFIRSCLIAGYFAIVSLSFLTGSTALACSPKLGAGIPCGFVDKPGMDKCPTLYCNESSEKCIENQCVPNNSGGGECPANKRCNTGMPRPGQPEYVCCTGESICVKVPGFPYGSCKLPGSGGGTGSSIPPGGSPSAPPAAPAGFGPSGSGKGNPPNGTGGNRGKPVGKGPAFCTDDNGTFEKTQRRFCINDKQQLPDCSANDKPEFSENRRRYKYDYNLPLTARDVHEVCQRL